MLRVPQRLEMVSAYPFIAQSGILASAEMISMIDPAGKGEVFNRPTSFFKPRKYAVSGVAITPC